MTKDEQIAALRTALETLRKRAKTLRKSRDLVGPAEYHDDWPKMKVWQKAMYDVGKEFDEAIRDILAAAPAQPAKAVDREAADETTASHPYVPDWREVHKGSAHLLTGDEQDLFSITRETLRHARSALRQINADDYYHTNGAAEREIIDALEHWNSHTIEREAVAALRTALIEMRQELFALCEDTEDRYAKIASENVEGKMGAYARGRIREAESIRNAMGEVFRLKLAALAAAPAQPQGGGKCAICDGAGEYETPAGRIVDCPKCAPDARREGEPS